MMDADRAGVVMSERRDEGGDVEEGKFVSMGEEE